MAWGAVRGGVVSHIRMPTSYILNVHGMANAQANSRGWTSFRGKAVAAPLARSRQLSSRGSDRSVAEQVRSRPALPSSAVGMAEGLWSGAARRRKSPCSRQVLVQDAIDDPQRMGPLLGRHLPNDEIYRIGQA